MNKRLKDEWRRGLSGIDINRYHLENFVGAGRIGYVYRATDKNYGHERAIKLTFTLKPGWEEEIRKVSKLGNVDGVVHWYEDGAATISYQDHSETCQYTVWDYIAPGRNLNNYLEKVGNVKTTFLFALVERILHVLHSCHELGVSRHGDLHGGNILIGDETRVRLDDLGNPREPIFVSDFGYGTTGGKKKPKDDYVGLAEIIDTVAERIDRVTLTATDKRLVTAMRHDLGKLLGETHKSELRPPDDLLKVVIGLKMGSESSVQKGFNGTSFGSGKEGALAESPATNVGQFQVAEMIGERWSVWKQLFVAAVPARSNILTLNIPTIVTGPRGSGKTMLFRRLSERLVVECGRVEEIPGEDQFIAFYISANDFPDAFSRFPDNPSGKEEGRLVSYAGLCFLSELLAVQSARLERLRESPPLQLLAIVRPLVLSKGSPPMVQGENWLEWVRSSIEDIKWRYPDESDPLDFPGFRLMSQHRWLPTFIRDARAACPWFGSRSVVLFIDDFSTPRVSASMQRVLNRTLLQRSSEFVAKLATEAWTTFVPEDSSGKVLQDGEDYQMIDLGEESLWLPDPERSAFLDAVLSIRLKADKRVPSIHATLAGVLGERKISKTQFARELRDAREDQQDTAPVAVDPRSKRRGRSRPKVFYFGDSVFSALWSGDTRTMIQLVAAIVDQHMEHTERTKANQSISVPVEPPSIGV